MSFLEVSQIIISFETEIETLDYLNDAIQYLITNYDNKKPFLFMGNEISNNIQLLCLLNTIITKLKKLKEPSEPTDKQQLNITEK